MKKTRITEFKREGLSYTEIAKENDISKNTIFADVMVSNGNKR